MAPMLRATLAALLIAGGAVPASAASGSAKAALPPELQVQRAALERTLEERLRDALGAFLQTKDVIPVVTVELVVTERGREGSAGGRTADYVLPGVPVDQELTKKEKGAVRLQAVRRVTATLYLGVKVAGPQLDRVNRIAQEVLDLDPDGGDTLQIESFEPGATSRLAYVPTAALGALVVVGLGFLLFLFGPFRGALRRIAEAISKQAASAGMMMSAGPAAPAASSGPAAAAEKAAVRIAGSAEGDEPLFDFINEDNIPGLVQALTNVSPVLVTSVLECLPRPLAAKALALFSREKRRDIVLQARQVRYSNPESIRKMEAQIRAKLGFAFGGVRKMSRILQRIDSATRAAVIEDVSRTDAGLAQQLRESVIEFEDLFRLDDRSLLKVVREASVVTLARVLKRRPDADLDRVCQKIGAELGDVLREQVSFTPALPPETVEEDFLRIVELVQRLDAAGSLTRPSGAQAAPAGR